MKDKWITDLHDRMADFETEVPDSLWDDIAADLQHAHSATRKKKIAIKAWSKRIASVAAILLLLIGGIHLLLQNDNSDIKFEIQDDYTRHIPKKVDDPKFDINENVVAQTRNSETKSLICRAIGPVAEPDAEIHDNNTGSATVSDTDHESLTVENQETKQPVPSHVQRTGNNSRQPIVHTRRTGSADSRLSMSIYTSGTTTYAANMTTRPGVANSLGADNAHWEDSPKLGIMLFNRGQSIDHDIRHHLPVRFGISFAYEINRRLSLESGLTYSNLTSDIKEGTDNHYFNGKQTLHYIGIPLNVRYNIVTCKRISVYGSAGVLAEQCVSSRLKKNYVIDHTPKLSETTSLHDNPFQFSVNAAAGVQINASSTVGFYVEPGLSYHFDDGTDIQTIYKDKPLNFSLNIGFRLTFGPH